ncbi:MAG: UbiA family prenyltransferase [Methanobacterium sp.]
MAALGSPCLIISTCLILNINIDIPLLLIAYLLPLIVYSYDYYKDIDKDIKSDSVRAHYLKKKAKNYPYLFSFYIISLILLLLLYSNLSLISFIVAIIMGGFLYNFLLKDLTKKIPAFKNLFTAIIWASGGAFFPLFYYSLDINLSFIIIFFLIFLRVIINIIFFDLKDMDNDKVDGLKTLPVILGKKYTINILNIINVIAFVPLVLGVYFNVINFLAIFLLIFIFYGYFYINKGNSASNSELESVSHTLADSEFILWPLLLLAINFLILHV